MKRAWAVGLVMAGTLQLAETARAQQPTVDLKVTDVAVFKDGMALVMAKGQVVQLEDGWCRTRDVPVPILGAFWAFTTDPSLRVDVVRSGMVEVEQTRPCLTIDEMIQANTGKRATIIEQVGQAPPTAHEGTLLGILRNEEAREVDLLQTLPEEYLPHGGWRPPQQVRTTRQDRQEQLASFVMLQVEGGVRLIGREHVRGVLLADAQPATVHSQKKQVREIALRVLKGDKPATGEVEIAIVYVQKGFRWIPDYRIDLRDGGRARVSLQATLINELADLEDVTLRLVVGVPNFLMKDERSPMALRDTAVQLGAYFAPPSHGRGTELRASFDNAIMSQVASPARAGELQGPSGPDVPMEGQAEDLFLYERSRVTLRKGERAVVPLIETDAAYEDIYVWDVPPLPPAELRGSSGQDAQRQLETVLTGARAMHKLRLTNEGKQPWTTAPATIFRDGTVLGQQLMTYTSPGNRADVGVTIATDLNTAKEESEVKRDPPEVVSGVKYTKVYLQGTLRVRNFKKTPVRLHVTRVVLGRVTNTSAEGKVEQVNRLEDLSVPAEWPGWWYGWVWPWWWYERNAVSRVTWEQELGPGEAIALEYDWHYYYRS